MESMESKVTNHLKKRLLMFLFASLGLGNILIFGLVIVIFMVGLSALFIDNETKENTNGFNSFCSTTGEVDMGAWSNVFDTQASGGLSGYGDTLLKYTRESGIDPVLVASIMLHETGNGSSKAVREYNNPGGIMTPESNWSKLRRFATMEEGIEYTVKNLRRRIIDDGLNTLDKLGSVYAPIGAANDPKGLNKNWVPNVTKFSVFLGGLTQNCEGTIAGNGGFKNIVNTMSKYMGFPYKLIGNADNPANGYLDCSGLMKFAYGQEGINLPRTSYEQYLYSQRIEKDDLRVGDFIFFKTASYNPVTHVGMYLGNNTMFHTIARGGVQIGNPFDSYWGKRIVGFGRVADFRESIKEE